MTKLALNDVCEVKALLEERRRAGSEWNGELLERDGVREVKR